MCMTTTIKEKVLVAVGSEDLMLSVCILLMCVAFISNSMNM